MRQRPRTWPARCPSGPADGPYQLYQMREPDWPRFDADADVHGYAVTGVAWDFGYPGAHTRLSVSLRRLADGLSLTLDLTRACIMPPAEVWRLVDDGFAEHVRMSSLYTRLHANPPALEVAWDRK